MTKVRLRYAPSPTGMLHIGGARTALFNYLYAKNSGGSFIVRIDDTDLKRNISGGEESQLEFLRWLGIQIDETVDTKSKYGPYRQSEKIAVYKKYLDKLLKLEKAYRCFCTDKELTSEKETQSREGKFNYMHLCPYKNLDSKKIELLLNKNKENTIRISVPKNKDVTWKDMIRGPITVNSSEIGEWVALRKSGIPTYNFTSVIDDHLMKITHVMRGEEHISNTPKQILLQETLNFNIPAYSHLTLIIGEDKKKLSKRNETVIQFISQYMNQGYLPEAIVNYLSLLGWSPRNEKEIFSIEELIKIFSSKGFSKSSAVFDVEKLKWYNNFYIKKLEEDNLLYFFDRFIGKNNIKTTSPNFRMQVYMLYREQIREASEILELSKMFFSTKSYSYEKQFLTKDNFLLAKEWIKELSKGRIETIEEISLIFNNIKSSLNLKGKDFFMPTRIIITSFAHGPDLKETIRLFGKEKTLKLLYNFIKLDN